MDKESLQLKCLANKPININNIQIQSKTLDEIVDLGYDTYNKYLSVFCFNEENVRKAFEDIKLTHYEYLAVLVLQGDNKDFILSALSYFINKNIKVASNGVMYYVDDILPITIEENTFNEIVYAVKLQNALIQEESEEIYNPANSKVAELLEKRKKAIEKIKKAKQKEQSEDEELTLLELVSALSCSADSNLNITNVWELNLYQFNDQFNRMVLKDNHDVNIRALLAGAKQEDLNMEHWMKKIH